MSLNKNNAVQITKEIFQVGRNQLTSSEDAAIYLIYFDGPAVLVDAGCGDGHDKLLANIQVCGVKREQIEYLLITHCHFDHTGGAKALKDLIHLQIESHKLEAPFLEKGDCRGKKEVADFIRWFMT